jgi:hypothetical protein
MAHSTSNEVTVRPTLLAQADPAIEQICSIAAVHFGRKWLISFKMRRKLCSTPAFNASVAKTPNRTCGVSPGENRKV